MATLTHDQQAARFRTRILYWTNQRRIKRGVEPVQSKDAMNHYAKTWSNRLADTDLFKHSEIGYLLNLLHANWVSENLAMVPDNFTPNEVVRAWMQSEHHRANLLNPRATHMGLGAVWDENRHSWVITQVFADLS